MKCFQHTINFDKTLDICPLIVKKLFLYNKYDYLITQFIPSLPYKTKGLYFNTLQYKTWKPTLYFLMMKIRKRKCYSL